MLKRYAVGDGAGNYASGHWFSRKMGKNPKLWTRRCDAERWQRLHNAQYQAHQHQVHLEVIEMALVPVQIFGASFPVSP